MRFVVFRKHLKKYYKGESKMLVCSKCNKQLNDDAQFCDNCNTPVFKTEENVNTKQVVKKKSLLVPVLIGAVTLVFFIAVGGFFVIKSGVSGKKSNSRIIKKEFYIKDKELFVSDMSGKEPIQLTSKFAKGQDNEMIVDYITDYAMTYAIDMDKNNKGVFFPDEFTEDSYTFYYKDISKPGKEAVKIDSNLLQPYSYYISDDGNIVTYLRDNNSIYQYNVKKKEKTKIDSDVQNWFSDLRIEAQGREILYIKGEGSLYVKKAGKDKEKIDSDVSEIVIPDLYDYWYSRDSLSTVFYLKDHKVYKKEEGKEKEKLVSDVDSIERAYTKQKTFYYTKEGEDSKKVLMDYVEDDMKEEDAAMEEPKGAPQYPSWLDYNSDQEYQKALDEYNKASEEYSKAWDEYYHKEQRDNLRQKLSEENLYESTKELYYYDGKEEKKISDNFISVESGTMEKPVIVFTTRIEDENSKIKLSEITDTDEVRVKINAYQEGAAIAIGDKVVNIEEEDAEKFLVSYDGNLVYFFKDIIEEENYGDLYEIRIEDNEVLKPKLYDEEVYSDDSCLRLYRNNDLIYFKDCNEVEDKATLYFNKKQVDDDVYTINISPSYKNTKEIYYYKDYDTYKEKGSLMFYNGNKSKFIADDVHDFKIRYDGSILYLCDYSLNNFEGDLRLYRKGKDKLMDEEVTAIISRYNYMEYAYYGF